MFLPHTDSFVLKRRTIVTPRVRVFLPHADSFVLIRRSAVAASFSPEAGSPHALIAELAPAPSQAGVWEQVANATPESVESADSEHSKISDQGRRNFLKIAGVAGAGVVASQLLSPNKASALIMGSSPTTGVVGVKNAANTRINPATEDTLSTLLKTSDLTFDTGSLQVKVTSLPSGGSSFSDSGDVAKSGLVDADRHVQVDVLSSALPTSASTETTLQTISFGGFKFTTRLATVGDVDYVGEASIGTATSAASWRIKKVDSTTGVIIQWAGSGVFDQIWDNRASLSYS